MERRDLLKLSPLAVAAATVGHVSLAEAQTEAHSTEAVYNVRTFGATGDLQTAHSSDRDANVIAVPYYA